MFTSLAPSRRRARRFAAFSLLLPLVMAANSLAEVPSNVTYTRSNVDYNRRSVIEVDPVTFALNITIPLSEYPGRGPGIAASLYYNSKVWRAVSAGHFFRDIDGSPVYKVQPIYSENSYAGWTSSLGVPFVEAVGGTEPFVAWGNGMGTLGNVTGEPWDAALTDTYYTCGEPTCPTNPYAYYIDRLLMHMPDGSSHPMRRSNHAYPVPFGGSGPYLAEDGSGMIFNASTNILSMPDGARYLLAAPGGVKYVDRNGNTLSHNTSTGQWTDTLGRVFDSPPLPGDTGEFNWSLLKAGGGTSPYLFRASSLADARSDPSDPLRYTGEVYYNPYEEYVSPSLFNSIASPTGITNQMLSNGAFLHNPVVLKELVLPNGEKYQFSYNIYGEIDKVVLPSGGVKRYRYDYIVNAEPNPNVFSQTNRGVVEMCESDDGNKCLTASANGSGESHWQFTTPLEGSFRRVVTAPDGTRTERYIPPSGGPDPFGVGASNPVAGRPTETRIYNAGNQLLRRTLHKWGMIATFGQMSASNNRSPITNINGLARDPRLTEQTEIMFDTGGDALSQTTKFEHDADLNIIVKKVYDYVAVAQATAQTTFTLPLGTLLLTEETTYLVNDPSIAQATRDAYRARNLIRLPSSTRLKNGAETMLAQATLSYDEYDGSAYPLLTYAGSVTGWTDPGAVVRGNATTTRNWLDTDGSWVETHAQYDQFGNVRNTWDAHPSTGPNHGNQSKIFFTDSFSGGSSPDSTYAYPTRAEMPAPDPSGQYGSTTAMVTTSVYDFQTGLLTSTTDANDQTTSFQYNDPFNRLKAVIRPAVAGRTDYDYNDTPGNSFVRTLTDLDETRRMETKQFFDGLGRIYRSQTYENLAPEAPWLTTDIEYDKLGRAIKVSRLYRAAGGPTPLTTAEWSNTKRTENVYDALGRVTTVTTRPDNAVARTDYRGNRTLITDQRNKQRIRVADGLGHLTDVWESAPNDSAQYPGVESIPSEVTAGLLGSAYGYHTEYLYDAADNLRRVKQGTQQRFFDYDSLARLVRAKNPEQGTLTPDTEFPALTDPVTENDQWSLAYVYDANGNLKARKDARNRRTGYEYDILNRNVTVDYSDTPSVNPDVARYFDGATRGKGRPWKACAGGRCDQAADTAAEKTVVAEYDEAGRPKVYQQFFKANGLWGPAFGLSCTYDLVGNVLTLNYPSERSVSYTYDIAGRPTSFSGNLGDSVQRTYSTGTVYDELGGVRQEQFGTQTPLYNKRFYNERGQLSQIRVGTAALPSENYNRGAIINHYSDLSWAGSGSDNNGNLHKQDVYIPLNEQHTSESLTTFFYYYDHLNRLDHVSEVRNSQTLWTQDYDYDRWGNRTVNQSNTQVYEQGATYTIPKPHFATSATNRLGVPQGNSGRMDYDAAGNLVNDTYSPGSFGNQNGEETRLFDAENRIVTVKDGNLQEVSRYTYDADGRRVRRKVSGVETWQVYGMGGELLAEYAKDALPTQPRKEYGYRHNELLVTAAMGTGGWGAPPSFTGPDPLLTGHQIKLENLTELRSAVNQLRQRAGLPSYNFTVDPNPQSNVTTVKAEHIRQLRTALEGARSQLGLSTGGYEHMALSENSSLIYAIDFQELRDQIRGAWQGGSGAVDIRWLVNDQLGTPRMMVDKTGSLAGVTRHDYLPFGEEAYASTGGRTSEQGYKGNVDGNRKRWAQLERDDETGLDYAQARYYSSVQGRFTSIDPGNAGADPENPQSWNGYAYALNNPTNLADPDGLKVYLYDKDGRYLGYLEDDVANAGLFNREWQRKNGHTVMRSLDGGRGKILDQNGELIGYYENTCCDWLEGSWRGEVVKQLTDPETWVDAIPGAILNTATNRLWSRTKQRTPAQNAFEHWKKHRSEFPHLQNSLQYAKEARKFVDNPPPGALVKIRANGDKVIWDPATNVFAVADRSGTPKTMFVADPAKHPFPTNLDYFNAQ